MPAKIRRRIIRTHGEDGVGEDGVVSAEAAIGAWTRGLRFFRFRETEIDGIPVVVARSGWSKQGGFEIYLRDGSLGGALWDRLMDAGRPFGIRPGAPSLIERIESRLISYGTDVTLEHDPLEAGLDAFCDLDKPAEYLARDALAARRGRPPARRLERVVIGGERRPPGGRLEIPPCGIAGSPP